MNDPAKSSRHVDASVAERRMLVRLLHGVNRLYSRNFHRLEVLSPCPLPPRGRAILVCNHTSGLDPLLIQSACQRRIVWMMAREYYELPGLHWIFKNLDAIPVDRSGRDVAATRAALRALASGAVLGVFPEGKISKTTNMLPFESGVSLMALKTKTPVFPAALEGTHRGDSMLNSFGISHSCRIAFGPPIDVNTSFFNEKPTLDAFTTRISDAVLKLLTALRVV